MSTPDMSTNRDYVTSTSVAAMTSTLTVVAADEAGLVGEVTGEGADPTGRVAAMLRLSSLFPYTAATDLALAGYDVLGYVPIPAWLVAE